jgi:hypothetical protein
MGHHPVNLPNYENLAELAKDIGEFRYDALEVFLGHLGNELEEQVAHDESHGRVKLVRSMRHVVESIQSAEESMHYSWRHCAPYMQKQLDEIPEVESISKERYDSSNRR